MDNSHFRHLSLIMKENAAEEFTERIKSESFDDDVDLQIKIEEQLPLLQKKCAISNNLHSISSTNNENDPSEFQINTPKQKKCSVVLERIRLKGSSTSGSISSVNKNMYYPHSYGSAIPIISVVEKVDSEERKISCPTICALERNSKPNIKLEEDISFSYLDIMKVPYANDLQLRPEQFILNDVPQSNENPLDDTERQSFNKNIITDKFDTNKSWQKINTELILLDIGIYEIEKIYQIIVTFINDKNDDKPVTSLSSRKEIPSNCAFPQEESIFDSSPTNENVIVDRNYDETEKTVPQLESDGKLFLGSNSILSSHTLITTEDVNNIDISASTEIVLHLNESNSSIEPAIASSYSEDSPIKIPSVMINVFTGQVNQQSPDISNSDRHLGPPFSPSKIAIHSVVDTKRSQMLNKYMRLTRPCVFCKKFYKDLSEHLKKVHKHEPEVVKIKGESNKTLRRRLFAKIRKRGCYEENKKRLGTNQNLLLERSKINPQKVALCSNCKGYFAARNVSSHVKRCTYNSEIPVLGKGYSSININIELANEMPVFHTLFKSRVLETLQKNNEFHQILGDFEILFIGNYSYSILLAKNKQRKTIRNEVSAIMRNLAKLKVKFNQAIKEDDLYNGSELSISQIFNCHFFDIFKNILQKIVFKATDSATDTEPVIQDGCAISYNNAIMRAIESLKNKYTIQKESKEMLQQIKEFEEFFKRNRFLIFGNIATVSKQKCSVNRMDDKLPSRKEIALITNACEQSIEKLSEHYMFIDESTFIELRRACLTKLILFNGRRPNEVASLQIHQWQLTKDKAYLPNEKIAKANEAEKKLLDEYLAIFNTGKRTEVPILVPRKLHDALDLLSDEIVRSNCKIKESNKYLFPSTKGSDSHTDGSNNVREYIKFKGLDIHLTSIQNRHMVSAEMNFSDNPKHIKKILAKFLGHSTQMNESVYQLPQALQTVTVVAPILEHINNIQMETNFDKNCQSDILGQETSELISDGYSLEFTSVYPTAESDDLDSTINRDACTPNKKKRVYPAESGSPLFVAQHSYDAQSSSSSKEEYFTPKKRMRKNATRKFTRLKCSKQMDDILIEEFGLFIEGNHKSYPSAATVDKFFDSHPEFLDHVESLKEKKFKLRYKLNNMKRLRSRNYHDECQLILKV